ncbi:hypothetical protein MBLNU230_g4178t1 [Neophaeotheca triangularis]
MAMSRLPLALRYIALSKATVGRTPSRLLQSPGRTSTLRDHLRHRGGRCSYATVDTSDTDSLWNKTGIDATPQFAPNARGDEESGVQVSRSESTTANPAKLDNSRQQLLTYVHSFSRGSKTNKPRNRKRWQLIKSKLNAVRKLPTSEADQQLKHLASILHAGKFFETFASEFKQAGEKRRATEARRLGNAASGGQAEPDAQSAPEAQSQGNAAKEPSPAMTLEQMQWTLPLPSPEAYPGADAHLFEPKQLYGALSNKCRELKLGMQVDLDFSQRFLGATRKANSNRKYQPQCAFVCAATLEIPEICSEIGRGEGQNKQLAKSAAWMHLVSKLHVSGALKQLFPGPEQPASGEGKDKAVEATSLDKETMSAEKDAKVDVYNYAAGFGLVPVFETRTVPARPGRRRRPGAPAKLQQTTIKLTERGIEVSAASQDLKTSGVAAALAFKQEAEQRHAAGDTAPSSALTVDTAIPFFDFLRSRVQNLSIEVEHESKKGNFNTAHLVINGEPAHQGVTMQTKKQAEAVAYLVAAIKITNDDPDLLKDFEQLLTKGKGKILRDLMPMDLDAEYEMLITMRQALVVAREAGLPDQRLVLEAEDAQQSSRPRKSARAISAADIAVADQRLLERQRAFMSDRNLASLRETKSKLPMNEHRDAVLEMISGSQYSIVQGLTGSGKTTQVPQIILEDAIWSKSGGSCNIICTQPRRIAATSVAQRVAEERNEPLRETVGYHVRNDAKLPLPGGSINYCTTGILLEQLKHDSDGVFDSTSHIIIDEVHERDMNIDFLMVVLRKAIAGRLETGKAVPKVVLMSATLDSELFAQYFANDSNAGQSTLCPSIAVPGRTFPVTEKHLGGIMQDLLHSGKNEINGLIDLDKRCRDYLSSETAFSASQGQSTSGSSSDLVIDWKRQRQPEIEGEPSAAQEKEEALVPVPLLAATLAHICNTTEDGAILAFLPGLDEIVKTRRFLEEHKIFGLNFNNKAKFKILPLHSTVPKEEQADIFNPAPEGCRKIILSTNIAETSVTVADVKYVVDTGKLREKRYDQVRRITKLQCVWESKSNAKQRAGRAGRVQDGYYYALFSKERHDSLRTVGLPELLRSDLQETCLEIKAQNFKEPVADFLAQAIEPPPQSAIAAAVENLKGMEAFTEEEELTDLGRLLSKLPVHPSLGKMIVLGVIFRCLDPMLVLGAAAEERSIFVTPIDRRDEARQAHRSYSTQNSDHLAFLSAFSELHTLRDQQGQHAMFQRSMEKFLHASAFRSIDGTAQQIVKTLSETGLIPKSTTAERGASLYSHSSLNRNSNNSSLIKCLLMAGHHPNLAAKYTSKGLLYRTPSEQAVLMHPASLNAKPTRGEQHPYGALFAYSTLARSNDGSTLYMRDCTQVSPLMATLFGGKLRMHSGNRLEMDAWLPFFVKADGRQFATKLILEFRKALDRVLNRAFKSLSSARPTDRGTFADDPVREVFSAGLVQALNQASGQQQQHQHQHQQHQQHQGWGALKGKLEGMPRARM